MPIVYPHACTLRLPAALAEAVQHTAAAQGVTRAELIRGTLRAALLPASGRRRGTPAPAAPRPGGTLATLADFELGNLDDLLGGWEPPPSA